MIGRAPDPDPAPPARVSLASPVGTILLEARGDRLTRLGFARGGESAPALGAGAPGVLRDAGAELDAYFAGELRGFTVPIDPGGTPFQRGVWDELRRVPFGATTSYGALAERLGRPGAARAVGLANARNPIAIVVPCHRVVGAGGALTGYAGGLGVKRRLLEHERRVAGVEPTLFSAST